MSHLAGDVDTVFLGGGTPTFTEPAALARLLSGLPAAAETTVEANPETVTPGLAALLREHGVDRVSLGAQSFQPHLLETLERQRPPGGRARAVHTLRDAGFDNVSLDLIYGIPGQSTGDLERDLAEALALEPEHLSCYELEAKPGTRFTHAHGEELERQADAMEDYFERVVETLTGAGYRWYETANFCRIDGDRDLRSRHNLGYWLGRDYLGIGVGAVSTVGGLRWRNAPSLPRYLASLGRGEAAAAGAGARRRGREGAGAAACSGLRLDEPLRTGGPRRGDRPGRATTSSNGTGSSLSAAPGRSRLTPRGRFLGGGVTAELLV